MSHSLLLPLNLQSEGKADLELWACETHSLFLTIWTCKPTLPHSVFYNQEIKARWRLSPLRFSSPECSQHQFCLIDFSATSVIKYFEDHTCSEIWVKILRQWIQKNRRRKTSCPSPKLGSCLLFFISSGPPHSSFSYSVQSSSLHLSISPPSTVTEEIWSLVRIRYKQLVAVSHAFRESCFLARNKVHPKLQCYTYLQ